MKPKKNYIILAVISLVTIIILLYALKWYEVYKEAYKNVAIINGSISEIKTTEFKIFINDKRNIVIYFGIPYNEDCRTFERGFKNLLSKYQLSEEIVYINIDSLQGDDFETRFNNEYNNDVLKAKGKLLEKVPTLAVFEDGKMVDFIGGNKLTKDSATKFLLKYNIINLWD
ncbi:MAG: thioredoxin family protein [Bacilli bacterium]|nr:thioredoxin family protein [Bacilli bacterium]